MGRNQFYIYLKSDVRTQGVYPDNRGGDFTVPLFAPRQLSTEDWETGVSSISFPDTFYNIYDDMRKVTFGNDLCEIHFMIPSGRYTPETFVATLNFAAKSGLLMDFKAEKNETFHELNLQLGKSFEMEEEDQEEEELEEDFPYSNECWERIKEEVLRKNKTTLFEQRKKLQFPVRDMKAEMKEGTRKFVSAIKEGKVPYFKTLHRGVPNPEEKDPEKEYVEFEKPHLYPFMHYLNHFNDEDENLKFLWFYRKSKLVFFYNRFTNKIGVRPFYKKNPLGDYVIFHDERLREMLGMSTADIRKVGPKKLGNKRCYLEKKSFRVFEYEQNFNLYCGNVFVYSDIVEESDLGNVKANILEILTVPERDLSKRSNRLNFPFPRPHYKGLNKNLVQSIGIKLCDELGQELKFNDNGKTLVDLHFRRIKKDPPTVRDIAEKRRDRKVKRLLRERGLQKPV